MPRKCCGPPATAYTPTMFTRIEPMTPRIGPGDSPQNRRPPQPPPRRMEASRTGQPADEEARTQESASETVPRYYTTVWNDYEGEFSRRSNMNELSM